jgi:3-deoxy-D-manno-octulosonate 8-phosphate phosphatase (KDO 8-P phosphatase)
VARRAAELGITECVQGHRRKEPEWDALTARLGLPDDDVAYMGDDYLDVPVLRRAGLAAAPADAAPEALEASHWAASRPGGRGAVRDLVELILRARGAWDRAIEREIGGG